MLMIEKNKENEIVIKKSRFINFLFIIEDTNDVEKYLNEVKLKYKDATHYCYAFILDNVKRFCDDGEPSGTAGVPMLNVLENQNLNYVLTITVRYFGGIKLGAGGLIRAYTKSVTENLKDLDISEYADGYSFDILIPYERKDTFEPKLKKYVKSIKYDNCINYNIVIKNEDYENLISSLNTYNIEIKNLKSIKIKKEC